MNYYPHNIGDFNSATRHLSRIERSVYRDMIDLYYDTEQSLTSDFNALCRLLIARTDEEMAAVQQMLNEFFTSTPTGWYHDRCEDEIEKYRACNSQRAQAGKASAAAKAAKKQQAINGDSTTVDPSLNDQPASVEQANNGASTKQEPRTKNQEPVTSKKTKASPEGDPAAPKYSALEALKSAGVEDQIAREWLAVRKNKKLLPTQTAIEGVLKAIAEAGMSANEGVTVCVTRSWGGFNASWLTPTQSARPQIAGPRIGMSDDEVKRLQREETEKGRRFLFGPRQMTDAERTIDA